MTAGQRVLASALDGYRIVQSLGVVRDITVRSRSILASALAQRQTIRGGDITRVKELCEQARAEAFELMLHHTEPHGGHAAIGVRYDADEIMRGVTAVWCYGAAVVVEPIG